MSKTGTAVVTFVDLEIVKAALNSAFYQNTALDLSDQYRKLSTRPQASAMTKALERAVDLIEQYLADSGEENGETTEE